MRRSVVKAIRNATILAATFAAGGLVFEPTAMAGGFQINEHGAIGTGRSGAVIGTVNTPSAIFHNPAGLTQVEGTQFMGGVSLIAPAATYRGRGRPSSPSTDEVTEIVGSTPIPVPYAYVTHALSKNAVVGLGFYNHYGLTIKWEDPDQFVGRTLVQELGLRNFFITPTVALKLSDNVSVAVGVSLVPATLTLTRVVGATDNGQVLFPGTGPGDEGTIELAGTAFGVGATAGIQIRLIDKLMLGFTYRSAIDLSFEGDGNFTLPEGTPASVAANFPDQSINGDLTLPHTFLAGIGWEENSWTVEFSAQVTMWSSYDELRLNFDSGLPTPTTALPRDWNVVPMFRLGGEYRTDMGLDFRAGLAYDVSPVPNQTIDPTLPDSDRIIGSFGLGYDFGPVRVDAAYMALFIQEREITAADNNLTFPPASDTDSVIYESNVIHLASLSVGVKL